MRRLSLTMLLVAACGGREDRGARDIVADSVVLLPETDGPLPFRIEHLGRLAAHDSASPLHLVQAPGYIGVDSLNRVFVYDLADSRIKTFDAEGHSLGTRGRPGGGPGEYRYLGILDVRPDGTLFVVDHGKDAVIEYDPQGRWVRDHSIRKLGSAYGGVAVYPGAVIIYGRTSDSTGRVMHRVRRIGEIDTVDLAVLYPTTPRLVSLRCPEGSSVTLQHPEVLLASRLVWTARGQRVAAAATSKYDVAVFDGDRRSLVIRREMPDLPATEAHVHRAHPDGIAIMQGLRCRIQPAALFAAFGVAASLPVIGRLQFSPDGSLWIERFSLPGDTPTLDVVDQNGRYLGTIGGIGFPIGFASNGHFVGLLADSASGAFQVHRYKIEVE